MRPLLLISICLYFVTGFSPQTDPSVPPLLKTLEVGKIDFFETDHFRNLYLVKGEEITKIDDREREKAKYSSPAYGDIFALDAFNPMRLLVHYRNFNQLIFLDNRLNDAGSPIPVDRYGFLDVRLAAVTDEEDVWMYDRAVDKLVKWSTGKKRIVHESMLISQLTNTESKPNALTSTVNYTYLNIPAKGILIFDRFGVYQDLIPHKNLETIAVLDRNLYFRGGDRQIITAMNVKTGEKKDYIVPGTMESWSVQKGRLYAYADGKIRIFELDF